MDALAKLTKMIGAARVVSNRGNAGYLWRLLCAPHWSKNPKIRLSCSPFPKDTPTAFFPLRPLGQRSSLGASLHINDTALTGCDGK